MRSKDCFIFDSEKQGVMRDGHVLRTKGSPGEDESGLTKQGVWECIYCLLGVLLALIAPGPM